MQEEGQEEWDHRVWSEQRLTELNSSPSKLNPWWYGLSFGLGAGAGIAGDKWSLGFVAATEDQVCEHLKAHLQTLPEDDHESRAILEQMLEDEARHASKSIESGGQRFPPPVKAAMTLMSKVMTKTTYHV